jgi:hypothetical protein
MSRLSRSCAGLFALSLIALTTGPAPAAVQPLWGRGSQNLSGMYSGSVTDSALGTGTAAANLAQLNIRGGGQGDPLGGWFAFTFGSSTYDNPTSATSGGGRHHCGGGGNQQFADCGQWGGGGSSTVGVFEMIVGSAACSFAYKASWSASTYQLTGSYESVVGCSGESGTFTLTQQCYYSVSGSLRRNTGSGPGACS